MQTSPRNRVLEWAVFVLVVLGCLVLLLQLSPLFSSVWKVFKIIAAPFSIAAVISYTLKPIVGLLVRRGVPRGISVILIYFAFLVVAAVISLNTIPSLVNQMSTFSDQLPSMIQEIDKWLDGITSGTRYLPDLLRTAVEDHLSRFQSGTIHWISQFLTQLGESLDQFLIAFVIPFLVFYMLKDLKLMERAVIAWFPTRYRAEWISLLRSVDSALGAYIRGQFLVMFA